MPFKPRMTCRDQAPRHCTVTGFFLRSTAFVAINPLYFTDLKCDGFVTGSEHDIREPVTKLCLYYQYVITCL